jgi:anti-sigma B factor antagonist
MLEVEFNERVTVFRFKGGRLDAKVARQFKDAIDALAKDGHIQLLFDMSSLEFMDSSGVGALVAGLKSVSKGGDLKLCSLRPSVASLLKLTRLDQIFSIYPDLEIAKASFL